MTQHIKRIEHDFVGLLQTMGEFVSEQEPIICHSQVEELIDIKTLMSFSFGP